MPSPEGSIEEDATHVLLHMAAFIEPDADPRTKGHSTWEALQLSKAVNLPATRLNDCVEILEEAGFVDVLRYLGTHPFSFGSVNLTSRGRVESERIERQRNLKPGDDSAHVPRAPLPSGSPYGFTDEDWETVALERADSSRLIVVFGHQYESKYFNTESLRRNVGEMFHNAVAALPLHLRGGISLDFRPLAGGYGEHLFNEIARDIISADVAVFETSDRNANVMIELGVALTWGVRVLPIRRLDALPLPSDISGQVWAVYEDDGEKWHHDHHTLKLKQLCERAIGKKIRTQERG